MLVRLKVVRIKKQLKNLISTGHHKSMIIFLCIISLLFVSILLSKKTFRYLDHVKDFLHSKRKLQINANSNYSQEKYQQFKCLTIIPNAGRLGNQMGSYATLYALADLNNRIPLVFRSMMKALKPYFHITAKLFLKFSVEINKTHKLHPYFYAEDGCIPNNKTILGGYLYPFSYTFFHRICHKIKREFRFRDHINFYAQNVLLNLKQQTGRSSVTFVGVHVRRTDYSGWLKHYNGIEASLQYYLKAMSYFRDKYPNAIFVTVSDDRGWCKKNFHNLTNVIITPDSPEAAYDMAVLVNCNHTIMSYGTFGFWSAYLAGGETVYFANYLHPNSTFLIDESYYNKTYLPNWIGISTVSSDF